MNNETMMGIYYSLRKFAYNKAIQKQLDIELKE